MAKEWATAFYNSKRWKDTRTAYIAHVFGLCERCHHTGYIVHHKIKLTPTNITDENITLNFANLEYLCKECHDREHYLDMHGNVCPDGFCFDVNGNFVRK